jgi:small conductance mechanosensitive channel
VNFESIKESIVYYGGRVILAIIFFIVAKIVISKVLETIKKGFKNKDLEPSLNSFLLSLIKAVLYVLVAITTASMIGIKTASFVAVLGAASLAIGFALQGSLSNFAGGVLILLLKPFRVGDYIESSGYSGTVEEIQIFYTILVTPDNKKVIIPNSNLSNASLVNYSAKETRRVDFEFGVSYNDDIHHVRSVLKRIADEDSRLLKDPSPQIQVSSHGDSAVVFIFRVWAKKEDYWPIYWDMMEKVKIEFDKEQIEMPYPKRDVNMIKG